MDPVTTAILAALAAGVVASAQKVGEQVLVDAYAALKELLKRKFGVKSEVVKAVRDVEKTTSPGHEQVLREEITKVKADKDSELLQAAQKILILIKNRPDGGEIIQNVVGNGNIVIAGNGNIVKSNSTIDNK